MDLALTTAKQVAELFILIFLGYVLYKGKIIKEESKKTLSDILVNVVVPAMIINSYMTEFNSKMLSNLLKEFGYSILLIVLGIVMTHLATLRSKPDGKGIVRFACSFSNAAYMGFPLIRALFGEEGILYASAYVTVFNIFLWTLGYMYVNKKMAVKDLIKQLVTCPPIISVVVGIIVFVFDIPVPELIRTPVKMVGDMNTPVSMMITGATIAGSSFIVLLKNSRTWKAIFLRLLIIPLLSLLLMWGIGAHGMAAMIALILEACPAAALTTVFAIKFHHDENLAVGIVVLSTLLSIVTLPLYAFVLSYVI